MSLTPQQLQVAGLIYSEGVKAGLSPSRARELVAASYAESGLNPHARNTQSGAGGLFQLLSSGYVNKANQLGGVYNPQANIASILPDYVRYWKGHPNAAPGDAGRDVEISGMGSGFYSKPLSLLPPSLGGTAPTPTAPGSAPQQAAQSLPPVSISPAALSRMNSLGAGSSLGGFSMPRQLNIVVDKGGSLKPPVRPGAPATSFGAGLVSSAAAQIGQPYVWGGESRKEGGFDCSGLVDFALRQHGYTGPRVTTWTLAKMGTSVKGQTLRPGDLVLANNNDHVVIYAGNGKVIAAPHTGTVVMYQPLSRFNVTDVRRL